MTDIQRFIDLLSYELYEYGPEGYLYTDVIIKKFLEDNNFLIFEDTSKEENE